MTESAADNLIGQILGGRYHLLAPVGTGGSARVYLAQDQMLKRHVAVKMLHRGLGADPRFARRFEVEAQASAQLNHPHILSVYDWSDSDPAYLVAELLDGGSLRTVLDTHGSLSVSQALLIGLQTAQGLVYAHARGFVHRDIKPANLLFDHDGRIRIADFGIARAVAEAAWTEPEGTLVGTARYAAPEQSGHGTLDGRADVYSLALTLVEAVTGTVPLSADSALATMVARQDTDVSAPQMGPLQAVIEAAGRANPEERITAEEFVRGLHQAATSLPRPQPVPIVPLDVEALAAAAALEGSDPNAAGVASDANARAEVEPTGSSSIDPGLSGTGANDADDLSDDPIDSWASDWQDNDDDDDIAAAGADGAGTASGGDDLDTTVGLSDTAIDRRDATEVLDLAAAPALDTARAELDVAPDSVVPPESDTPERRRRRWPWAIVAVLLLAVGGSALAYQQDWIPQEWIEMVNPPTTHPVGTYVGRPLEQVERDIVANHWELSITRQRQDDTVVDEVIGQAPDPGIEWEEGLVVSLTVSDGPLLRSVPELIGIGRHDALERIQDAGLAVGAVDELHSEDVAADVVLEASAEPGAELETGSVIDVVISLGPAPRTVPELAGENLETATATLEELGLVLIAQEASSMDVPEGRIIETVPPAGESQPRGAEIEVIVSTGKPYIEVPNVTGMTAAAAADELERRGFVVRAVEGDPRAEVLATNPPAGEFHRHGTGISLFTR